MRGYFRSLIREKRSWCLVTYTVTALKRNKQDDRIKLVGIKIFPQIGVTEEERSSRQKCEADLSIWDNFEGAASRDSIKAAIDYIKETTPVPSVADHSGSPSDTSTRSNNQSARDTGGVK